MNVTTTTDAPQRPSFLGSATRWSVSGVNSLLHFIPLLVVSPFSRSAAWAIYRHWGQMACRIFGIRVSQRDDNNGDLGPRPHLYVWLNQTSLAEALTLRLLPPVYKIVNLEYAAMPLIGWTCVLLRDIVIVRQWKKQAKRGIERAAARLVRGETWAISIEGARTPDGGLLPYKKGPIVMAISAQATIIPMVMKGGRDVMPRGEWRIRPGHIELRLLKSIPTQGLTYDDRNAVYQRLRQLAERELQQGAVQQHDATGVID
jgi:1-acyl-sn-glycerol-3-phosphate acyltransferase